VQDLLDYLEDNPPVQRMVAAYLKVGEHQQEEHVVMNKEELEAFLRTHQ
jgi:hypothetical protein